MNQLPARDMAASARDQELQQPHHRILGIEVAGGFLDGARLDFSDGLNCIIGGRGTGKTTVLEFIRYILGMMPDPADSRPRARAIEGHVRGNLGSGMIYLEVETKHGTRYRAERPWGDDVQVLDRDSDPVPVSLDRDLVFKADIYSQNEIEEIATNPRFQLSLIDKFEEEAIRAAGADIQKVKREIAASAAELRDLEHHIRETQEVVPEIEVVGKRLQEMQLVEGADADLINAAHAHKALRTRETEAIVDLRKAVGAASSSYRRFAERVVEECAKALGDGLREGPNGSLFDELATAAQDFVSVFRDTVTEVEDRCGALLSRLDDAGRRLAAEHARQEQQYREIVARSAEEKQHAAERAKLQQRHLALTKARQELDSLVQKRKTLEAAHRQMNTRLSELRDQRFRLRKEVAERLSTALAPTIRVSITQAGDRSAYEALLKDMLKGSGLQYNRIVSRIVESLSPEELSRIVRRGDAVRLAEDGGIAEDQALRIVSHLQGSDQIGRLETIDLEDEPLIALKDGTDFKNSADLSTGQRCTVILPILLLESERPLLIDQPDDRADWREAWALFPGDVAYVWHAGVHARTVAESLEAAGFPVRSQIIWAKPRFVLGRGDYHWQHEPCLYAVRKGATGHWQGARDQSTLWAIGATGHEDEATVHGTQKPVECMRRPIVNNSAKGGAIYEPFAGSGTTIIAAETVGRRCLAMEIDPRYCDVVVDRWQRFTGGTAVLDGEGVAFDEAKAARAA